jgi:hypothetical protein
MCGTRGGATERKEEKKEEGVKKNVRYVCCDAVAMIDLFVLPWGCRGEQRRAV